MRITSRPELGTTVELWLPVSQTAEAERPRPAAVPRVADSRCCRVLVVDDDPIVLSGTVAMLEDLGHSVSDATSAERALEMLRVDASVDLVITDHAMPGMTGTELAQQIRRSWPELPIIIATGYADLPGEGELGLPRLLKPYRQQELAEIVAKLVGDLPIASRAAVGAGAR
jgi:CheY-like chemotaxis protein